MLGFLHQTCLQARHVLCLQARHLLFLQPRHLLCRQTGHLWSPKTSQLHCQHGRAAAVFATPLGCLGRSKISCLLTQLMSCLQTQQMSRLQAQQRTCLETQQDCVFRPLRRRTTIPPLTAPNFSTGQLLASQRNSLLTAEKMSACHKEYLCFPQGASLLSTWSISGAHRRHCALLTIHNVL